MITQQCRHRTAEVGSRKSEVGRGGFTLIEMVAVISLTAAMMSFAVVLLGLLLRTDTAGHEALASQMTYSRLSRQFRTDAHRSSTVTEPAEPTGALELQLDDGSQVVWSAAGGDITRTARRGDSVVSRETYEFSDGEAILSREPSGNVIAVRHSRPYAEPLENAVDDRPQPRVEFRILAAVGIGADVPAPAAGAATPATGDAN